MRRLSILAILLALPGVVAAEPTSGVDSVMYRPSYDTNGSGCNNGSAQNTDDYDTHGYLYAIDLPANATSMNLEVYDGAWNRSGSTMDNTLCGSCTESITIFVACRPRALAITMSMSPLSIAMKLSPLIFARTNRSDRVSDRPSSALTKAVTPRIESAHRHAHVLLPAPAAP